MGEENLDKITVADKNEADVDNTDTQEPSTDSGSTENSEDLLTKVSKEAEEYKTQFLRMRADFENFKRRVQGEREQLASFVTVEILQKILPVLDNFHRAESSFASADIDQLRTGIELVKRQMVQSLEDIGLEKIPALHEQFNAEVHEAVMSSTNPELADGTIDAVFEEGYTVKGKVVRHSKVKVVNN